jgi:peptidoglycan/LPS O-acetylase OafA/YrhL
MCHHRRIAPLSVLFILLAFSALPAAAQPGRAAETAASGLRWIALWQNFIAPFTVLTDEGRAIWDPNGDPTPAPPPSGGDTVDGMADGGGVPL